MTNAQKLQQLILNESVIDYNELVDLADKTVKDEEKMIKLIQEIDNIIKS